ncbi:MAG: energy-coupling factor transporter transmembrane component T family protein [Eggerthellaceae bacterium]|jgi:energy-coupling factor transport system permease protein
MFDAKVIGRYWPGSSPIHHMDARAKILLSLFLMVNIFLAATFLSLGVCIIFMIAFFKIADIPFSQALRAIVPLLFIIIITAILNLFFVQGGPVLWSWTILCISAQGLYQAVFISLRLLLLLLSVTLLTMTTPLLEIADAFEKLLSPFKRFGVPAHELSMMMSIALRFTPQFAQEFRVIYHAQTSRGARFKLSMRKKGLGIMSSFIVPLFASAFSHAHVLAQAMDARCYHGGDHRTKLRPHYLGRIDKIATLGVIIMCACIVFANLLTV